jgi:NADH:ubiquinone oxidoreductase subunit K
MMNPQTLVIVAAGVLALFGVGLIGLMITRNLLKAVAVMQVFGKAAVLALVLAGRASGNVQLGQSMATTVIVADTVVAVIGLALAVQIHRHFGTLDLAKLASLKG